MKKMLALLLCVVLLCGCTPQQRRSKTYLDLFDTVLEISAYEPNERVFEQNCQAVYELVSEYHTLCDIYHPSDNGVYAVNENAGIAPVAVDDRLFALLKFAKDMAVGTDSHCNIAMGSVLSLWHDAREKGGSLPDEVALQQAAMHCDINNLILKEQTAYLADAQMQLDLGAVAKGYVTERAAELLESRGASGYLINFGGNVRAVGEKPNGEGFLSGVQDPSGNGIIAKIPLADSSLVTSGDYQRGYMVDGKWYHHIIDPDTLYPAEYFKSVSVVYPDSGVADCLSTALFTMSIADGKEMLMQFDGVQVLWVDTNGAVTQTGDFSA